ncbi:MAG: hypothetical protein ABJG41_09920 [Cyclobacteriaceae bacterium]
MNDRITLKWEYKTGSPLISGFLAEYCEQFGFKLQDHEKDIEGVTARSYEYPGATFEERNWTFHHAFECLEQYVAPKGHQVKSLVFGVEREHQEEITSPFIAFELIAQVAIYCNTYRMVVYSIFVKRARKPKARKPKATEETAHSWLDSIKTESAPNPLANL